MREFLIIAFYILQTYFYIMIVFVLLSWVPSIRQSRFYYILSRIVEPYLGIFRGWIVFSNIDFTPMLGLLLYQFLLSVIARAI